MPTWISVRLPLFLAFWCVLTPPTLRSQPAVEPPLRTLTEVRQILSLPPTEAERGHPVRFRGIVTAYEQRSQLCFVQDQTAGIYTYNANSILELKPGDVVDVKGVSGAGLFSPIVNRAELVVTGSGPLPEPRRIAIERLASGREDSQWVEVAGIIHAEEENWGHLVLDLVEGTSRLKVRVLNFPAKDRVPLTDARVTMRGVAATQYNNKRQMTGFYLVVPGMDQITIEVPPPDDPLSAPIRSSRSLLAYSSTGSSEHRVRLQGVVTMHLPGQILFIRDASGGVRIETLQKDVLTAGDRVDVLGFASPGGYNPVLRDAIFRRIGQSEVPAPTPVSLVQAVSGDFHNELVEIQGVFLESEQVQKEYRVLLLQAEKRLFRVHVATDGEAKFANILKGTLLKARGICSVDLREDREPASFTILLRSPSDLLVLRRPSSSVIARLTWVFGGLAAIVLIGLTWMVSMRRRVQQQTELIQRREATVEERYRDLFENANDIIYTHDLAGNLTSINKAGERIIGYTREEALKMNVTDLVAPHYREILRQNGEAKLGLASGSTFEVEIRAKDGRELVLEVRTRLNYLEGKLIGVQGIARDITERRRAEEALRESESQLRQSLQMQEQIGRDLHDGIIQSIYAVGLRIEDCRRVVCSEPEAVEARLTKVASDLNLVIRDVRNFIGGLEPEILKGQEFKTALKSLVLTLGEAEGAHFVLRIDPASADALNPKQATNLLFIAREAMSNSVRHSKSPRTTVSLQSHNGYIRFQVQDDGVGFERSSVEQRGYGLKNMSIRAQSLQAEFNVISHVGGGTRIVLDLPRDKNT